MKGKILRRIAAAAMVLAVVGSNLPASIGISGLSDGFTLTAGAEADYADASTLFGKLNDKGQHTLESKTYTLNTDLYSSGSVLVPKDVEAVVDLNGHTFKRETEHETYFSMFYVKEGGKLTVKNGTVTDGCNVSYGRGFLAYGDLKLEDVTITNFTTCCTNGGGIFLRKGASAELKGNCVITDNRVIDGYGTVIDYGGGIYVENGAMLYMEGKPVIKDNSGLNVYLESGSKINITGKLNEGTNVGVTHKDEGKECFTDGYSENNTESPDNFFFSDTDGTIKLHEGEVWKAYEYEQRSWNEEEQKVDSVTNSVVKYTTFDKVSVNQDGDINISSQNGEWYIVRKNTLLQHKVQCFIETNIILCDGCTLTCQNGLINEDNNVLNIYAQENDSGKLISTDYSRGTTGSAGIGGSYGHTNGDIYIHGGTIKATGRGGSGIGSGFESEMLHNVTIYGGDITATGEGTGRVNGGAGIGVGGSPIDSNSMEYDSNIVTSDVLGTIAIYGGTVRAVSVAESAGIGCSINGDLKGDVIIKGGNVTAKGDSFGAGIGTSNGLIVNKYKGRVSGRIIITGGSVRAETGNHIVCTSSAIGCGGYCGSPANFTGQIILGDDMCVRVGHLYDMGNGNFEYDSSNAFNDEREKKVLIKSENNTVCSAVAEITKCEHTRCDYTLTEDNSCHIIHCKHCKYTETSPHIINSEGVCEVCGYNTDVPVYTVTLNLQNENGGVYGKDGGRVISGSTYILPLCDSVPEDKMFTGWTVGEDTVLRQPGEEITVESNVSVIAQYAEVSYISGAILTLEGDIGVNVYLKASSLLDGDSYVTV